MAIAYLCLGSNLGNKINNLNQALKEIKNLKMVKVLRASSIYETEPVGFKDQSWFLNAAVKIKTKLPPLSLLYLLQGIERKLGRVKGKRWGPRKVDLDILLYNNVILKDVKLTLPHPQMHKRRFVLIPLVELGSRWKHPSLNLTPKMLLDKIKTSQQVRLSEEKWQA
ncbi:MAG TPA: 2-amino-4-hydroxy-6-hydroxymethyldihydropteridine diphosphokinase [Terriglobales bacterium]|nr:2-amino-4-hydroxy-6-hydroxymethyldihydropteridine diphosphokinase [Terriglobales bacterium]